MNKETLPKWYSGCELINLIREIHEERRGNIMMISGMVNCLSQFKELAINSNISVVEAAAQHGWAPVKLIELMDKLRCAGIDPDRVGTEKHNENTLFQTFLSY